VSIRNKKEKGRCGQEAGDARVAKTYPLDSHTTKLNTPTFHDGHSLGRGRKESQIRERTKSNIRPKRRARTQSSSTRQRWLGG